MVQFPTEYRGLIETAAAELGILLIIAPSVRCYKVGDR
jgi:hypothetical protein